MFNVYVTNGFMDELSEIPVKYSAMLVSNIERVEKICEDDFCTDKQSFIFDMLRQIKNHEMD